MVQDDYLKALLYGMDPEISLSDSPILERAAAIAQLEQTGGGLVALKSILGKLADQGIHRWYEPGVLSLEEQAIFAQAKSSKAVDQGVRDQIIDGLSTLRKHYANEDSEAYRYSLHHFVQTYGARVAYGTHDDTSLFDRNRVMAALSASLKATNGEPSFVLLKGTISGIQRYIYDNVKAEQIGQAERTAKRLRGRSFLISFINQVIAEVIVEQFDVEQANILFVGGGQFMMLLPDISDFEEKINDIVKAINLGFIERLGMNIGLLIAYENCNESLREEYPSIVDQVHQKLGQNKMQRHSSYLEDVFDQFHAKQVEVNMEFAKAEEERLGELTPYANFILEIAGLEEDKLEALQSAINKPPATIRRFSFLKRLYYIVERRTEQDRGDRWVLARSLFYFLQQHEATFKSFDACLRIIALNESDLMGLMAIFSSLDLTIGFGYRFLGKYTPTYTYDHLSAREDLKEMEEKRHLGGIQFFDDLAALNESDQMKLKYRQLGVMRLDVDDLGTLLKSGLTEPRIDEVVCLSRELQLFFGGYFNKIAAQHHVYVVYSGGDDAFVLGSWLNVILFARSLEKDFRQFTLGNQYVNFSAGIFMCNPHYPIPRFAKDAERLEKAAKQFEHKDEHGNPRQKNTIHLFNQNLPWPTFEAMMIYEEELQALLPSDEQREVKGRNINRSMLHRLLRTIQATRGDVIERYRSIAGLHSLMARHGYGDKALNKERLDGAGAKVKELLQLVSQEDEQAKTRLDYLTVPIHMALYKTKKN
ncbi:MAG: hypothetical protein AAF798_10795 [Bacteroidota bacterium]